MSTDNWLATGESEVVERDIVVAGVAIGVQTLLLAWVRLASNAPDVGRFAVFALSVVSGASVYHAFRERDPGPAATWWNPDWRFWFAGVFLPGLNLGAWVALVLRTREVSASDRPTARWKYRAVGGAIVAAVGTGIVQQGANGTVAESIAGVVALVALAAVGFTVVATYYDTRYVMRVIENAGSSWLFAGLHWVLVLSVVIPLNFVLSFVYLYRRRMLLGLATRGQWTLDELAAGEAMDGTPIRPDEDEGSATGDDDDSTAGDDR